MKSNSYKEPAVLVDIDGVLCDVPYYMGDNPEDFSWEDFVKADLDRTPIAAGITLVKILMQRGIKPIFLTARPEFMRRQTEEMLEAYGLHGYMYMASNETSKEIKRNYQTHQMIEKDRIIREEGLTDRYHFLYAIDDQEYNAKMYKDWWGIPTLQARFV